MIRTCVWVHLCCGYCLNWKGVVVVGEEVSLWGCRWMSGLGTDLGSLYSKMARKDVRGRGLFLREVEAEQVWR